jgi:hypothetical protein
MANSLSMYSITENIYYSQLSSVAILLQPEPNCFTSYNTRKACVLFLSAIVLRSLTPSHVSSSNGQRSSQLFCVHYTSKWSFLWCVAFMPVRSVVILISAGKHQLTKKLAVDWHWGQSPEEVTGETGSNRRLEKISLRNEKLHNLYVLPNIVKKWK